MPRRIKDGSDKHLVKKPYYEGGKKALDAFIKKNMKYPKEAAAKRLEGSVQVRFVVDNKGKVIEAKSFSNAGHGFDEEAVRIVKLLRYKVPKNPHRMKIRFNKRLQIHFKPPKGKAKPKAQKTSFSYSYQSTNKEVQKEKSSGSYNYSIKW